MDIGKAILWTSIVLVASGIVGYVFGFREARPTISAFAMVGAVAVLVAAITVVAITVAAMGRAFLRPRSLHVSLDRLTVGVRIGLVWIGIAIVAGINIGAFLGFTIGLRTAQFVSDILFVVGVVALVASASVLIGIMYTRRSRYRCRDDIRR